jgi:hypothetical protein
VCVGEEVKGHGTFHAYWRFTYTPSGNEILQLKGDYDTDDPFWFEGLASGDRWDLTHGVDVGGWVAKDNGPPFMMHYQWHEKYASQVSEDFQLHVKGHFLIGSDGSVKMDRYDYRFVCN